MTIAVDVDGVITEAPRFFAAMTQAMRSAGHEIHIVTDSDEHFRGQREKELAGYGVVYDALVITEDKIGYCRANGIEIAIDDDDSYYQAGTAPVPITLFRIED